MSWKWHLMHEVTRWMWPISYCTLLEKKLFIHSFPWRGYYRIVEAPFPNKCRKKDLHQLLILNTPLSILTIVRHTILIVWHSLFVVVADRSLNFRKYTFFFSEIVFHWYINSVSTIKHSMEIWVKESGKKIKLNNIVVFKNNSGKPNMITPYQV